MKRFYRAIAAVILTFLLAACSTPKPPLEFAPEGEIIQKAIAMQIAQTQQGIGQQLNATRPDAEVSQINVKKIEPVVVGTLPTYHLKGTYNLTLNLARQKVTQKNNRFDLYLQRQIEGKTWRLLKRKFDVDSQENSWASYIIQ
jgi:PBP1b-binding outer membrane lipoprotein LpoB